MHKAIAGILGVAVIAAAVSKITHTGESTPPKEPVVVAATEPAGTVASGLSETFQDGVPQDVEATNFDPPRKPRASGAAVEPKPATRPDAKSAAELLEQIRSERIRDAIKDNQKKMDKMVKSDDAMSKPNEKNVDTQPMTDVTVEATPQPSVLQPSVMQPSVLQPLVLQPSVTQPSVMQPGTTDQIFTEFDVRYGNAIDGEAYYFVPSSQQPVVHETIGQGSYSTAVPKKGCCLTNGRLSHLNANQLWEGYRPERDW